MLHSDADEVERGATSRPASSTRQGYHMLHWTATDYNYWEMSDLAPAELQQFARLMQQPE